MLVYALAEGNFLHKHFRGSRDLARLVKLKSVVDKVKFFLSDPVSVRFEEREGKWVGICDKSYTGWNVKTK